MRIEAHSFMRIIPTWEKPTCVRSRLGRTLRIREAQAAHSHTTSHIERDLPAQRLSLGENAASKRQIPPFLAQRPGLGEIDRNKIPPRENVRIAQANYLGKRWGTSLLEKAFLSQAGTLCQTRPAFASQIREFLLSRDLAQLRLAQKRG